MRYSWVTAARRWLRHRPLASPATREVRKAMDLGYRPSAAAEEQMRRKARAAA